jgi:hypothetical protein
MALGLRPEQVLWPHFREWTVEQSFPAERIVSSRPCDILDPNVFMECVVTAEYGNNRRDQALDEARRFYSLPGVEFHKLLTRRVEKQIQLNK